MTYSMTSMESTENITVIRDVHVNYTAFCYGGLV